MDGLTIRGVGVSILRAPVSESIGMSFGGLGQRTMALVEVEAEGGLVGYGESWINYLPWAEYERVATIREGLAPLLVGQDASQINKLHARMAGDLVPMGVQWGAVGPIMQAISGVDLALWDLVGKARGFAISDLLGGRVRDKVPVYASGLGLKDVEETATQCREDGFTAVKVRIGLSDIDEGNLALVRRSMGSDVALFADANQAWNLREALAAADMLARYDVEWVEEPIRDNRAEALEEFHNKTGLRVATGENVYGAKGFLPYATSTGIDVIQPDVSKTGGITETVSVCYLAGACDKAVIPHLYGGPIAQAATLQLAACMQQVDYVEFDVRENPLRDNLLVRPLQPKDGCLEIPKDAGLGVEIDQETLSSSISTDPASRRS